LPSEAQKRLKALMEFTELGSGFKIAFHDLQIRGAGNLLGQAQSGHLAEVGYELYLQLLERPFGNLKGRPRKSWPRTRKSACRWRPICPEDYVPDIQQRLALYRRLSGRLPRPWWTNWKRSCWTASGRFPRRGGSSSGWCAPRSACGSLGVKRLEVQDGFAVVQFAAPERLDLERLLNLLKKRPENFRLSPDQTLRLRLPGEGSPWAGLEICLKELETFVKGE
jgi:transcription-repair coupling factor (superfamily II helicase)